MPSVLFMLFTSRLSWLTVKTWPAAKLDTQQWLEVEMHRFQFLWSIPISANSLEPLVTLILLILRMNEWDGIFVLRTKTKSTYL